MYKGFYFRDVNHMISLVFNKKTAIYLIGIEFGGQQARERYMVTCDNLRHTVAAMRRFSYVERFKYNGGMISDTDWGCTIRSGQMLLFNTILFKLFKGNSANCANLMVFFQDQEFFGINNFLKIGEEVFAKKIGEMWSPKTFFLVIQHILAKRENCLPVIIKEQVKKLVVLIMDSNFVASQIESRFGPDVNILLVINLSIGMHAPEDKYRQFLLDVCRIPQFCGIVGGQNSMSYFIVGHNGTFFYYLDPHQIKSQEGQGDMNSYTVTGFHEISYCGLLPYITLTFIVNRANFDVFREMLERANSESQPLGMFASSEIFKSTDTMCENDDLINFEYLNMKGDLTKDSPTHPSKMHLAQSIQNDQRERIPSFEEIETSPGDLDESISSFKQITFDEIFKKRTGQNVQLLDEVEGFHEVTILEESPRAQVNLNTRVQQPIPSTFMKKPYSNLAIQTKKSEKTNNFSAVPKPSFKKH